MAVLPTLNKCKTIDENRSMGRISIICLIFFLLLIPIGISAELKGFTYFLSGRDGAGHTLFDRFELYPNGKMSWQVASKGGGCPSEAGIFQGQLSQQEKNKILQLVNKLYQDEKGAKKTLLEVGDSSRHPRHLFQIEFDSAVYSFELGLPFGHSQSFFQELAFVKSKLLPLRAVRMSVGQKEKSPKKEQAPGLLVSFFNIGSDAYRFLLPKNPEETFFLNNGQKISYRTPIKKRDILLAPGKTFDLVLDVQGEIQGPLFYDSGVMVHHGLSNLKKDLPPLLEVFLCAGESL